MSTRLVGQVLGRYRVIRLLGEGGMGVVYEVVDTRLDRRAALKILRAELARDLEQRSHLERGLGLRELAPNRRALERAGAAGAQYQSYPGSAVRVLVAGRCGGPVQTFATLTRKTSPRESSTSSPPSG